MLSNPTIQQPVILFDGVCNLCSAVVRFVIRHDKKDLFRFASLQSDFGQAVLTKHNLNPTAFNSFILFQQNKVYSKSTAALMVAKQLSGVWPLLYCLIIVPPFIRNAVYNYVAANRYKWFGKKEECWVPTPELHKKFFNT
jgi:predicted DCC family thiol-disulfide oxidoreductase YuxK